MGGGDGTGCAPAVVAAATATTITGAAVEEGSAMAEVVAGTATPLLLQHQYICSACGQLYDTLEEVFLHQQQHAQPSPAEPPTPSGSLPGDGHFQCLECSELLLSPEELLAHQDAHTRDTDPPIGPLQGQVQYHCGNCEELFLSPDLWLAHCEACPAPEEPEPLPPSPVATMDPYECPECAQLLDTPEEFLEHQGTHFASLEKEEADGGEDEEGSCTEGAAAEVEEASHIRQCGDGQGTWGSEEELRRPRRAAHAPAATLHHCAQCQRGFSSANRLLAHGRAHVGGTHECPACSKVFKKATSLEQHLRLHRGEARYLCVDCGRGFGTELTLVAHRRAHTANPLHRCPCGKTFSNMTKFLYHRRTHAGKSGAPPPPPPAPPPPPPSPPAALSCPHCTKAFSSAARLARHRRAVHSPPERRHRCGVCGKGFKKLVHVRNHLRTHTGERPFQCHACGKTFASLANLSRHQLTHTGARPYPCPDCGKRFTQSSNLQQHRLLHGRSAAFSRASRLQARLATVRSLYGKGAASSGTLGRAGLRHPQRGHPGRDEPKPPPRPAAPPTPPAPAPQQTIMCTELGETIAIIETSQPLALADTLQLCQVALGAGGLLHLDTAFV
ncbi:zinc finger protein 526 isoform X1 [Dromiciops gliroides]|uniref:zinc finger protein 526 isoform X1 n=2 Tax=Dromiciops gliroides TaxID=33562 RepID=UPI001CC49AC8|nr:zinc finger protein 526 isoform X1 [Dromiciops gliroides]